MSIADTRRFWLYQYCRYWKILENTGFTSIADTGILGMKLRNVLVYCFFCPVCASVMRGRTVYRETGRKETRGGVKRGGRNEKMGGRGGERRRGAGEWISIPPAHPLYYGTAFLRLTPSFQHRSSKSCI